MNKYQLNQKLYFIHDDYIYLSPVRRITIDHYEGCQPVVLYGFKIFDGEDYVNVGRTENNVSDKIENLPVMEEGE